MKRKGLGIILTICVIATIGISFAAASGTKKAPVAPPTPLLRRSQSK